MNGHPSDHFTDEQLSAFAEDDLDGELAGEIQDHIAVCEICRATVDQLKEARGLLASLPREVAPELFSSRVKSRIRRRSRGRFFSDSAPSGYRITLLVTAIILVLLAALYFMSQLGPQLRDGTTGLRGDELREQYDRPDTPELDGAP